MEVNLSIEHYPRIELLGAPTALNYLPRLSDYMEREIYIKRDDITGMVPGGNKLRKLEYLVADALQQGADVLLTAGAIQSNHVRQTAAVAAKVGLKCMALLENPINSHDQNYLANGNRLLLDLFGVEVINVGQLTDPDAQLQEQAELLQAQGFRPYVIPVGGSNLLGALGYVSCAQEIALQSEDLQNFSAVIVASGSGGTHAGLAVGLEHYLPGTDLVGIAVSRQAEAQKGKIESLRCPLAAELGWEASQDLQVWDRYYQPGYGFSNQAGNQAIRLVAQLEGILLDPVYTGKAMAGLLDGITQQRFTSQGPLLFIHTGGAPALFAYHSLS